MTSDLSFSQASHLIKAASKFNAVVSKILGNGAVPAKRKYTRRAEVAPAPVKRNISPETSKLRAIQGQYMGHVRGLTDPQKNRVKKVREKSGYRSAIALAKRLSA